jgi:protein-S-isoprenylcysteine O-methyltransferase Ste14
MPHQIHQPSDFYGWYFLIFAIVTTLIRLPFVLAHQQAKLRRQIVLRYQPLAETLIAIFVGFSLIGLPIVNIISPSLDRWNFVLPDYVRLISAAGLAIALIFITASHLSLGRQWSGVLETKKNHQLVTTGLYQYVRHPMYTGFFFWAVFVGLLLPNWLTLLASLFCYALLYFVRIPAEEAMMIKQFGPAYRDYQQRTGRIFPKIKA